MPELAEIFRQAGGEYCRRFGERMLPSHLRAMHDIVHCRTPFFGGHLYQCDAPDCRALQFSYHSCRNRHCPKCQHDQAQRWLDKLNARLLPCDYFLTTFTLPAELRPLARSNQRTLYDILLREAAASLQRLADDPRWIGGRLGILAVLHTWSRDMAYHPHVHLLATAGGLTDDQTTWIRPANPRFPLPGYALAKIFRAKVRDALHHDGLLDPRHARVFNKPWVAHVRRPEPAATLAQYLSRYLYRVALTNQRIEAFENSRVTFRFVHSRSHQLKRLTLPVDRFIARFLQHVLPRRFAKIRYYGLFSPNSRNRHQRARDLLEQHTSSNSSTPDDSKPLPRQPQSPSLQLSTAPPAPATRRCPSCQCGLLRPLRGIPPTRAPPSKNLAA